MKDPARTPPPPPACHNCGEWLATDEWYTCRACTEAIGWSYRKYDARANKALVALRCTPWDQVIDEQKRHYFPDGDMCMADGSICHYDNAREKMRLERINMIHVGADMSGQKMDSNGKLEGGI